MPTILWIASILITWFIIFPLMGKKESAESLCMILTGIFSILYLIYLGAKHGLDIDFPDIDIFD